MKLGQKKISTNLTTTDDYYRLLLKTIIANVYRVHAEEAVRSNQPQNLVFQETLSPFFMRSIAFILILALYVIRNIQ